MKRRNFIKTIAAGITGLAAGGVVSKELIDNYVCDSLNPVDIMHSMSIDQYGFDNVDHNSFNDANDYLNVGNGIFFMIME